MQKEIILSISEFFDRQMNNLTYDGFEIQTNEQTIILAIDNVTQCCEDVGYFMTNDDLNEFIGAILLDIDYVDGDLKVHTVKKQYTMQDNQGTIHNCACDEYFVDIKRNIQMNDFQNYAMFVNLHTSAGKLQFVAYNAGNGYYGHDFRLISRQKILQAGI